MPSAWSVDQILGMAPDAGAAKAGRELAVTRKWVKLGCAPNLLWGECQGSGASPYQTKIDVTEPAFNCSCPSRKFPCKHSLGLFLLWVEQPGAFGQEEPPQWVASWLEGRAERAEKKVQKEKEREEKRELGEPAVQPESRRGRESNRQIKVTSGLDDLSLWVGDLLRAGLTTAQGRPRGAWDEQARRLIDAQAPGVARRVRQLEQLPVSGKMWHAPFLERLASLHLLIEGWRRREAMLPDVYAELNAVIGLTVDQGEVLAGPGVRDLWQVIGVQVTTEDRLRVQRTWLLGRDTGKVALVLHFAHGNQPLDTTLPPGVALDAELAFFPGTLPLRALVKTRHAPPVQIERLRGHETVASAYDEYASALARNPWLELYPLVIEGVLIPCAEQTWMLRDSSGGVLPIAREYPHSWHLLGFSGGNPIVLISEFDGDELEPLGCWMGGRLRVLPSLELRAPGKGMPATGTAPELAEAWQEALSCALVGVDRKAPPSVVPAGPCATALYGLGDRQATDRLLGFASAASWYSRVGRKPASDPRNPPEPCGPDDRAECAAAPTARLRQMVQGVHGDALEEWLTALTAHGQRLPEELLPNLLALGRRQSELRPALRDALGQRGRWLASRNPEWSYVGGEADLAEPEVVWQTGTTPERLIGLKSLRAREPDRARELLLSTWAKEPADDRAAFLDVLAVGLSMADEPFLESALDDRSKQVRRKAAEQLARVPESRFCERMIARAKACLSWEGEHFIVNLPEVCDASMVRDGIDAKPASGTGERSWWLLQIVSCVPLSIWRHDTGETPERLTQAIRGTEWDTVLWTAWATACRGDTAWATALMRHPPQDSVAFNHHRLRLLGTLPRDERESFLIEILRSIPDPLESAHPAFHMFNELRGPLGLELAGEILSRVRQAVSAECEAVARERDDSPTEPAPVPFVRDWGVHRFISRVGGILPIALLHEAEDSRPTEELTRLYLGVAYEQMLANLRFRSEMLEELAR
ncbi:MAG TPA: DUF5691 domain-containing protein [Isosphaeraceae bacterium]|nr:DUF5691 domain-containing protein [Isosphaeraceae bacterium]